jgi:hypothetical protein
LAATSQQNFPNHDENGIFVANRRGTGFGATVYQVADWMHRLTRMGRRERIALRNRVENHADHFDWNNLAKPLRRGSAARPRIMLWQG